MCIRHAFLGEPLHHVEHLADELGVQRAGRLVEEHELGLHRERPGDRDPLLLAAGQVRRIVVGPIGEADAGQELARLLLHACPGQSLHPDRRLHHVLQRRHVREQVEALEHHSDVAPLAGGILRVQLVQPAVRLTVADEFAVDAEPAGGEHLEVVDAAQEGGLSRSARTDQAHDLAALHLERDALQDLVGAEALRDPLGEHHGHLCSGCRVRARVGHRTPPVPGLAGGEHLEVVDAAQEGGLSRSARTDQAHDLAALHLERDALQDLVRAEALRDPLGEHHGHLCSGCRVRARVGHRTPPVPGLAGGLPSLGGSRTVGWPEPTTGRVPVAGAGSFRSGRRSPTPRAKRFSRKYWPTIRIEVKNRYQIDATMSIGIGLNVSAEMSRDRVYRSKLYGTAVTSEVVFSIEMTSLPVGGMITRIDWGRMTRHMVWNQLMPSAVAASSWPMSTASRPARTISAMYAASLSASPMIASVNVLSAALVSKEYHGFRNGIPMSMLL